MNDTGVSVSVDIEDGRTVIEVSGDPDAAVVVRSESGERIYLPPEESAVERDSSYATAYDAADSDAADSPYQSADSPYQSAGGRQTPGIEPTADGFRIVHPEEVTDFRLLR
jgi:hypothetical protein